MRYAPLALNDAAWSRALDALRFDYCKWDLHVRGRGTVARGALVLARDEHATLVAASEALHALADRAMARLPADADATRALGVPEALAPLARPGAASRVTRFDWFLTDEGWRVSELNDDVPGGYNDAIGLGALLHDAVEKDVVLEGDLPASLVDLLARGGGPVGLVYATAYAEDLQVIRLLAALLESAGVETVAASPAHLRDGRLDGARVETLYRFYPAEWFPLLDNLPEWERAIADGLRVVNPFASAWTQSKAFFSWLHERHGADPRVRAHVPRTLPLDEARALAEQERWVLKPAFGRMGEGVVLGALRPRDEWRAALASAAHRRRVHVMQERFLVKPLEIAPGEARTPCVGAYLVDGRFAGYYSRLSSTPVVAYDAANVLTLVERV